MGDARKLATDLDTFEGDSGSPIYLSETNRFYAGKVHRGRVQLILGLMSGQHFIDEEVKMIYGSSKLKHRLGLGSVVHAAFIREVIDLFAQTRSPACPASRQRPRSLIYVGIMVVLTPGSRSPSIRTR